ncbi:MAG: hypothetical protein IT342_13230 [Candidatus Melainabacteria bacterium]|nr:hypothetical protein [Candidatus Melainabacteria bacterium]
MKHKPVFIGGNQRSLLVFAASMAIATSACTKEKVAITVEPPVVKVERLKNVVCKKQDPSPPDHETARTDWLFSISPEVDFSIADEKKEQDGYHLWIEVTGVRLKVALPIATFISDQAPQYVVQHERGHERICRRVYANSRQYALAAANSVIGRRFEGFGKDRKTALSDALQIAGQEIVSPYKAKTAFVADKVSSRYDQLCQKEDRRKSVEKTIEDAFSSLEEENNKQD